MQAISSSRATTAAIVLAAMVGASNVLAAPEGSRWGADYFPNHPVTTHEGKTVRFYDDLIKNKMVVVNFIYTHCPDICSLSTARLAEVVRKLGESVNRDVYVYSISMDPENDTPAVLAQYAKAFSTPSGWLFITGGKEQLHEIRHKLGERSRKLSEHRSDVVLGNDTTGEWSRSSIMVNPEYLVSNIQSLDPEWRKAAGTRQGKALSKAAHSGHKIGNTPGKGLFLKACASCHSIGKGDRVGPDLAGVTKRRARDWLVRFIMRPDLMRAGKDSIAVELDARYEGVKMPNLSLSKTDAGDLISYIESQTKKTISQINGTQQPALARH